MRMHKGVHKASRWDPDGFNRGTVGGPNFVLTLIFFISQNVP